LESGLTLISIEDVKKTKLVYGGDISFEFKHLFLDILMIFNEEPIALHAVILNIAQTQKSIQEDFQNIEEKKIENDKSVNDEANKDIELVIKNNEEVKKDDTNPIVIIQDDKKNIPDDKKNKNNFDKPIQPPKKTGGRVNNLNVAKEKSKFLDSVALIDHTSGRQRKTVTNKTEEEDEEALLKKKKLLEKKRKINKATSKKEKKIESVDSDYNKNYVLFLYSTTVF
jgi:hypothetical protein